VTLVGNYLSRLSSIYTPGEPLLGDTLQTGVPAYVSDTGDLETIPWTGTPPEGEPTLLGPWAGPGGETADVLETPYAGDPPFSEDVEDLMLHDAIHGPGLQGYNIESWANPSNPGIPNLGPVNAQPLMGGASSTSGSSPRDPSVEQGWGMDPAVILARYPHSENVNPFYNQYVYRRFGTYNEVWAGPEYGAFSNIADELRWQDVLNSGSGHARLVDNPQGVPYSSTVPIGGGYTGQEYIPDSDEAVYA
jgi:hypothetical protein